MTRAMALCSYWPHCSKDKEQPPGHMKATSWSRDQAPSSHSSSSTPWETILQAVKTRWGLKFLFMSFYSALPDMFLSQGDNNVPSVCKSKGRKRPVNMSKSLFACTDRLGWLISGFWTGTPVLYSRLLIWKQQPVPLVTGDSSPSNISHVTVNLMGTRQHQASHMHISTSSFHFPCKQGLPGVPELSWVKDSGGTTCVCWFI